MMLFGFNYPEIVRATSENVIFTETTAEEHFFGFLAKSCHDRPLFYRAMDPRESETSLSMLRIQL